MSIDQNTSTSDPHNADDLYVTNLSEAQISLKKAYLLLSYGHFNQAINSCTEATKLCPDNYLAPSLHGAILVAAGRINEAIQHLSRVMRRFPNEILPRLYFCEACLLGGRTQRGLKELGTIGKTITEDSPWFPFYENVQATFEGLDPSQIPAPLVVPDAPDEETLQG